MKETIIIGTHHIQREDDVVWIVEQGLISLAEMQAMFALLRRWQAEYQVQYLVHDMRRLLPFEADVRKYVLKESKTLRFRGFIAIGASPAVRIMTNIITEAIKPLGLMQGSLHLVKTEAEAWAWIEEDRKKYQKGR